MENKKKAYELVNRFRGKTHLTIDEAVEMFTLYNEINGTKEVTYDCSVCAIRIYDGLKKTAEEYERSLKNKKQKNEKKGE